jgi:hypothetical protein
MPHQGDTSAVSLPDFADVGQFLVLQVEGVVRKAGNGAGDGGSDGGARGGGGGIAGRGDGQEGGIAGLCGGGDSGGRVGRRGRLGEGGGRVRGRGQTEGGTRGKLELLEVAFGAERPARGRHRWSVSELDRGHFVASHHSGCVRDDPQIRDMPSPIDSLPIEILSDIFTRLIRLDHDADWGLKGYQKCLRQALVLTSVSSPFRYAAFATHDLWMRVPLVIASPEDVEKASSLLRLCTTLAHCVQIFVNETLTDHESARSAIDILLTPDTTLKVKAFHLYESYNSTDLWLSKFQGPSFPILTILNVRAGQMGAITSDLTTLTSLTQLRMDSCYSPVIVPPSVQYLASINVSQHSFISLLYQYPNLIECYFEIDIWI